MRIAKLLTIAAVTAIIGSTLSTPASASETCKHVTLKVVNNTGKKVKVIDIDYKDYGRKSWRSEAIRNQVIPKGDDWKWRRNLEGVNHEKTQISVQYRVRKSNGKYKLKTIKQLSNRKTCTKGKTFTIKLTKK